MHDLGINNIIMSLCIRSTIKEFFGNGVKKIAVCGYLQVTPRNGTALNRQRREDGRWQQVEPRGGKCLSLQWQGVNAVVVYYFSAAHYVALT